jgi:hypothetical protein
MSEIEQGIRDLLARYKALSDENIHLQGVINLAYKQRLQEDYAGLLGLLMGARSPCSFENEGAEK